MTIAAAYFETKDEALQEVRKRKSRSSDTAMLVRCEQTGYGTWRVLSVPADFVIDSMADGPVPFAGVHGFQTQNPKWLK